MRSPVPSWHLSVNISITTQGCQVEDLLCAWHDHVFAIAGKLDDLNAASLMLCAPKQADLRQEKRHAAKLEIDLQDAMLHNMQLSADNAQQLAQLRDHSAHIDDLLQQAKDGDRRRHVPGCFLQPLPCHATLHSICECHCMHWQSSRQRFT